MKTNTFTRRVLDHAAEERLLNHLRTRFSEELAGNTRERELSRTPRKEPRPISLMGVIRFFTVTARSNEQRRREQTEDARFWGALAESAEMLLRAQHLRSLWEMHWGVSKGFVEDLTRFAKRSSERSAMSAPSSSSGRPTEKWRDDLVDAIRAFYTERTTLGAANETTADRKHFRDTVRLVLEGMGAPVADLKSLILRAKDRRTGAK